MTPTSASSTGVPNTAIRHTLKALLAASILPDCDRYAILIADSPIGRCHPPEKGSATVALLVNTSRTVKPGMPATDKARYTLGVWPYQRGQTLPDIEESADMIFGVTSGVVTFGALVDRVVPATTDPNRWEVIAAANTPQRITDLIGRRVAPAFSWKPGQGWPVKLVDTDDFLDAHADGDPEVSLGAFRLSIDEAGLAHLYLPRGADVRIHVAA